MLLEGVLVSNNSSPVSVNFEFDENEPLTLQSHIQAILDGDVQIHFSSTFTLFSTQSDMGRPLNAWMWRYTRQKLYGRVLFFGEVCALVPTSVDKPEVKVPQNLTLSQFWSIFTQRPSEPKLNLCHMFFDIADFDVKYMPSVQVFPDNNNWNKILSVLIERVKFDTGITVLTQSTNTVEAPSPVKVLDPQTNRKLFERHIKPYCTKNADLLILPEMEYRRWRNNLCRSTAIV